MAKQYPQVTETRREFIREKRRQLKATKKACARLRMGCALHDLFDGTPSYQRAVHDLESALNKIDKITKPIC